MNKLLLFWQLCLNILNIQYEKNIKVHNITFVNVTKKCLGLISSHTDKIMLAWLLLNTIFQIFYRLNDFYDAKENFIQ